ncbi:sugar-transfer associated ATP-grasp domain-containing protein [Thermophilibacter mediterraneus]|uniref:sugar-transfer associated ATP-grasp domain-containing protein n=1 Tax=Thermophilibacter mediterraneus TaxID=1871031 RepID=UPI000931B229|nr:sugar-transfer associated ATP-grasp domain-containing protein [Thermophilibacter mediterraneus]
MSENNDLERMLSEGFTRRFATGYLRTLERERESGLFDADYLAWCHAHGFTGESACAYGLTDHTLGSYLSDYDYARLWPLNGWQRIWINDKLTLNALVQGTDLERYVPAYFYYTEPDRLLPLAGSAWRPGVEGLLRTLRERGEFACKPCNGSLAKGFHHLAWDGGSYLVDGEEVGAAGVEAFVAGHPNYVFTEFIRPEASLARVNPLIHTIRTLVLDPTGCDPVPAMTYLRFGMGDPASGTGANYVEPTTADICSFNVHVDVATGAYGDGRLVYANRVEECREHPVSGVAAEGVVPRWDELLEMVRRIALKVGACEYLGFDACMTERGPMIMEINSHTGIKYLQLFRPVFDDPVAGPYFERRLARLDSLSEDERRARSTIVR